MCKICAPILGSSTLCKSEKECPLRQAAYCAQCACTGHFQSECSYQPKMVLKEIPCLRQEPRPEKLYLRDDPKTVLAFLSKHKLPTIRMKEGLDEEERRKIEEKQKKTVKTYLIKAEVDVVFIQTAWTKKKSKER